METSIQSIHFDASDQLKSFIVKKASRLDKFSDEIRKVEVSLTVVKPETSLNKKASVSLLVAGGKIFAEKVCDSFEEAFEVALDAASRQYAKYKEKNRI